MISHSCRQRGINTLRVYTSVFNNLSSHRNMCFRSFIHLKKKLLMHPRATEKWLKNQSIEIVMRAPHSVNFLLLHYMWNSNSFIWPSSGNLWNVFWAARESALGLLSKTLDFHMPLDVAWWWDAGSIALII